MAFTKRDLQSMMTRERIRLAAISLMREKSIEEVSVNDILKKANVGTGTFYHYYKTKDEVVLEVYGEMDAFFLQLANKADVDNMSPYEYVCQHILCYVKFVTQSGVDFAKKIYAIQSKVFIDESRPVYSTLKNFLEHKQSSGEISPELNIENFCNYIMISLRGIAYDWCVRDGSYDLIEHGMVYAGKILSCYRAQLSA